MRVTLVNHSDTLGGASVVTLRLMQALRKKGIDARMLVNRKSSCNPYVEECGPRWLSKAAFITEHAEIYLRNGFSRRDLFKASIATVGLPLHRHPLIKDADVVVLNWVNQGMLSLAEIARIEAPTVWTMHDMWCLTGVCHHAGECNRYMRSCGHCPLMHGGSSARDLSSSTFSRKQRLYAEKKIKFVAVSRWLADKFAKSALTAGMTPAVIPNAFPVEDFYTSPRRSRSELGLPTQDKLVIMGAARLDDPIKGLDIAVDALNRVAALRSDAAAVFFGDLRDTDALRGLQMPYVHLGRVADAALLREIYSHGSVVLSASHYETLPGTLVEGIASGCMAATFGQGGQPDIVDHGHNGFIADFPSAQSLAEAIGRAIDAEPDRNELRGGMERRFGSEMIAQRYINLFDSL